MKLKNPNYQSAAQLFVAANKAAILAYINSFPADVKFKSYDEIRADFPARNDLTDTMLNAVFSELGFNVEL